VRPTAGHDPLVTSYGLSSAGVTAQSGKCLARKRKVSGMTWIFLSLLGFFLVAGVFTALFAPRRAFNPPGIVQSATPRSFFGVDGFEDSEAGVTFDDVEPPDSPADKAGLIGGDIIKTYDGQNVEDADRMGELLRNTPVGKTVDVVYVRDGETKTTKLTTISRDDGDRLAKAFERRPEGKGYLGYNGGERVEVEGTKLFGVQLKRVEPSRPADLFGLKPDDIIVQFGDTPIRTDEELRARIRRTLPYTTVDITVYRGTEKLKIPVKLGRQ
jgi:S1-C subfamily serine protease